MRTKAQRAMAFTIISGLTAVRANRASTWAETYRRMGEPFPGRFTFDHHPWTKEMLDDDAEECVGQKAAQMGFTDSVGLNRTFYTIDRLRRDVLYILPAKTPDATDFSAGRFDPALELSPHLNQLFTNVKNVGHKRAGANNLYVRGSRSRSALKSIPAGLIVLDEEDEFDQEAIILVRERVSGQMQSQIWHISTPSIPGDGVNVVFERSNKAHFFFKCPHCGRHIELVYPDSLTPNAYICTACKAEITQNEKRVALQSGIWVPQKDSTIRGYQINQMYSYVWDAERFYRAAELSQTSPAEEQEFHNSKLGEAHVVENASVTSTQVLACLRNYKMKERLGGIITMGIDVGTKIHVEIDQWRYQDASTTDLNDAMIPSLSFACTVDEFEELDNLVYLFKPLSVVIDHQPETRKALEFARRYTPGRVRLCHYADRDNLRGKEQITVNRTAWLDRSLGRIMHGSIDLPTDTPVEWQEQVQRLVRVPKKDTRGEVIYRYHKTGADHYGHARNYSEIALGCLSIAGTESTSERHQ